MEESFTGMHRCHTFSRRDGKASFEGYRRSGQSRIHGESSNGVILSEQSYNLCRNMTFEIRRLSKKAFDIRMSFTILLDEITQQSMAYPNILSSSYSCYLEILILKMFMSKEQSV